MKNFLAILLTLAVPVFAEINLGPSTTFSSLTSFGCIKTGQTGDVFNANCTAGKVGIGTVLPLGILDVQVGGAAQTPRNPGISIQNGAANSTVGLNLITGTAGVGEISFNPTAGNRGAINHENSALSFITNGSTNVVMTAAGGMTVAGPTFTVGTSTLVVTGGKVGIGTTNPGTPLEVSGAGINVTGTLYRQGMFHLNSGDTQGVALGYDSAAGGVIYPDTTATGQPLAFWTFNGATWGERMRLTKEGNVGIGTTAPIATLDVVNSSAATHTDFVVNTSTLVVTGGRVGIGIAAPCSTCTLHMVTASNSLSFGENTTALQIRGNQGSVIDVNVGNVQNGRSQLTLTNANGTGYLCYDTSAGGQCLTGSAAKSFNVFNNNAFPLHLGAGALHMTVLPTSGNVGIGEASPSQKLDISAGAILLDMDRPLMWGDGSVRIGGYDNNDLKILTGGHDHGIYYGTGDFAFGVNRTDTSTITASGEWRGGGTGNNWYKGNVGIGTTNPGHTLTLASTNSSALFNTTGASGTLSTDAITYAGSYQPPLATVSSDYDALGPVFISNRATSSGVTMSVLKTRASRPNTDADTVVASGDNILTLKGGGADGTLFRDAASIAMDVDATPGASDMPGRITFNTTPDGSATLAERMRITNSGNVGIGTTNPTSALHVVGAVTFTSKTKAQFDALDPTVVGETYFCSDCTVPNLCVSSGTAVAQWRRTDLSTAGCGSGE